MTTVIRIPHIRKVPDVDLQYQIIFPLTKFAHPFRTRKGGMEGLISLREQKLIDHEMFKELISVVMVLPIPNEDVVFLPRAKSVQ